MHNKNEMEPIDATTASVIKEMAKPRMSRSARIAELHLDPERIPEQPSTTMPGAVDKIFPPRGSSQPEKVQIAIGGLTAGIEISVSKMYSLTSMEVKGSLKKDLNLR